MSWNGREKENATTLDGEELCARTDKRESKIVENKRNESSKIANKTNQKGEKWEETQQQIRQQRQRQPREKKV